MSCQTAYPVVFIHGVFGYGKRHPLWNWWIPYWPESLIERLNTNHIITEVGSLSSDHDRACEVFYQLYGGTVDYGKDHSSKANHEQFGRTYLTAAYPQWSDENPLHLIGHSFGATTAIELYQMLCKDAFHVGSSSKWVRSIICIAGPLSGTTLTHALGVQNNKLTRYGLAHILSMLVIVWFKLSQDFPILNKVWDIHMDQWKKHATTYKKCLSLTDNPIWNTVDLAVFSAAPEIRAEKNRALESMEKVYLMSIVTSPKCVIVPAVEIFLTVLLFVLIRSKLYLRKWLHRFRWGPFALISVALGYRLSKYNVARSPTMYWIAWLVRRASMRLIRLSSKVENRWEHNDGVVNIHSMMYPRCAKPPVYRNGLKESVRKEHSLVDVESESGEMQKPLQRLQSHISLNSLPSHIEGSSTSSFDTGCWYVYRVHSNHLTGMFWDGKAEDLYANLFHLIANYFE